MPPKPRRRRQAVHFPSAEQSSPPISDAELDAEIDGVADAGNRRESNAPQPSKKSSFEKLKEETDKKKQNVAAIKEIPVIFTAEDVVWVFDVYVGLICFVFSILLRCDFKIIYEELELDAAVKEAWAKPLAKIASKYAPAEWAGMTAEIQLICGMGLWTAAAFGRSKIIAEKEKQRKEDEKRHPRNTVTAMPNTPQSAQATI
jgi:hypothetical protein